MAVAVSLLDPLPFSLVLVLLLFLFLGPLARGRVIVALGSSELQLLEAELQVVLLWFRGCGGPGRE